MFMWSAGLVAPVVQAQQLLRAAAGERPGGATPAVRLRGPAADDWPAARRGAESAPAALRYQLSGRWRVRRPRPRRAVRAATWMRSRRIASPFDNALLSKMTGICRTVLRDRQAQQGVDMDADRPRELLALDVGLLREVAEDVTALVPACGGRTVEDLLRHVAGGYLHCSSRIVPQGTG